MIHYICKVIDLILFFYLRSMIETLLSYGYDAKTSFLQTAHYYRDYHDTCTQDLKDAEKLPVTSGYERRRRIVQKSQIVPFGTGLHIDFLTCPRFVINIF